MKEPPWKSTFLKTRGNLPPECPRCGKAAKLIEAGVPWSSYYCGPCNVFFWRRVRGDAAELSEGEEARQRQEATQLAGRDEEGNLIFRASKLDERETGRTDEKIAKAARVNLNGTETEEASVMTLRDKLGRFRRGDVKH